VNYPIIKARAAYWAGHAAEVAGDRKVAATSFSEASRYDTTYYGQLAAARMGVTVRLISASIEPTDSDISTFNRDERVHAVKMRNQISARDYIQPFVRALLGGTTNPGRQFLTANLARK
jgi:soluble lytic murein transglycosylase